MGSGFKPLARQRDKCDTVTGVTQHDPHPPGLFPGVGFFLFGFSRQTLVRPGPLSGGRILPMCIDLRFTCCSRPGSGWAYWQFSRRLELEYATELGSLVVSFSGTRFQLFRTPIAPPTDEA